jgi:hypothetical protein
LQAPFKFPLSKRSNSTLVEVSLEADVRNRMFLNALSLAFAVYQRYKPVWSPLRNK